MKQYKRKPQFVEAVQVTAGDANWGFAGSILVDHLSHKFAALTDFGLVKGKVGDWIVKFPTGNVSVFSDAAFHKSFEEVN